MDQVDFISQFGRYVDAHSATVFVGAGLSQSVGYPGWEALLDPLRLELGIEPMEDMPQLAQYIVDGLDDGRERLRSRVVEAFDAVDKPVPSLALRLIAQLPIDEYWTSNFDSLLQEAAGDVHVYAKDEDLALLLEPGHGRIYKMHGSLDPPGELVLTRDDYETYSFTHPRFWKLLQAHFLTKTLLFVGIGFSDPNLDLVFKLVRVFTTDIKREHFAIVRRPAKEGDAGEKTKLFDLRMNELERVGVNVVVIDDFVEIDEILGKLVARCRPPQVMVSGSAPEEVERTSTGGSYPTAELPSRSVVIASLVGEQFAHKGIASVAGGEIGAAVGYAAMRTLDGTDSYVSDRFTLVRRKRDEPVTSPNTRLGQIVFTGSEPTDLRSAALSEVRALLVFGGGSGTQAEVASALESGLGVVPIGCTGGIAESLWNQMHGDLEGLLLGGRPVEGADFDLLMSEDDDEVAAAAVRLVEQAMYLS